jgi:ABC-type multidrug transport system ATPase subunit
LHFPQILLLDEPDAGLDEEGKILLETLLDEHTSSSGTILFTTHHLELAQKLSNRIVTLSGGRIIHQDAVLDKR